MFKTLTIIYFISKIHYITSIKLYVFFIRLAYKSQIFM